jgi:hypothetical protein
MTNCAKRSNSISASPPIRARWDADRAVPCWVRHVAGDSYGRAGSGSMA